MKTLSEQITNDIRSVQNGLKVKLDELQKTQQYLKGALTRIEKKPWPFGDARKLLDGLAARMKGVAKEDVVHLHENLKKALDDWAQAYERSFLDELKEEAKKIDVPFGIAAGTYFLGPFEVVLQFREETCVLKYAKQPVAPAITLDAAQLVAASVELSDLLIKPPVEIEKLAKDFEEAIRVSLIRNKKATEGRELHCPLPELHREMTLLRQDRSRVATSTSFREYPLARFVVELKMLVQAESNLTAAKRFRLETAVIENTGNPKKSVFLPTDVLRGFGEGTYFQAAILVNEGTSVR